MVSKRLGPAKSSKASALLCAKSEVATSEKMATHRKDIRVRIACSLLSRTTWRVCRFKRGEYTPRDCGASLPNPRVRHRIQQIRKKVHRNVSQPNRQDAALHEVVVAI